MLFHKREKQKQSIDILLNLLSGICGKTPKKLATFLSETKIDKFSGKSLGTSETRSML